MELDKNTATEKAYATIRNSWTYEKLTKEERNTLWDVLDKIVVKGGFRQRYEQIMNCYTLYLAGLGYFKAPTTWREEKVVNTL